MSAEWIRVAEHWRKTAARTLTTAKALRDSGDPRSCVSRAYYAAYQAATAICIEHGDSASFPAGWNNPSHEQLPGLIASNGDLRIAVRRSVRRTLLMLRFLREDADYRVGRTVDAQTVATALIEASALFELLEINRDDN